MSLTTTLAAIRSFKPCKEGWEKLLASKGLDYPTYQVFSLQDVLVSNGVEDAIWCLRAIREDKEVIGRIAKEFAQSVAHLRSSRVAYAAAAADAADAAAYAAAYAVAYAAYAAADAAAYAAAYDAAADDAADDAAAYDAYEVARKAEREKQAIILAKYF